MKHEPIAQTEPEPGPLASYTPVPRRAQWNGWTADRQRGFLTALADTGSVSTACKAVGITPRSAYRLRNHPDGAAFAAAWEHALYVATGTLTALAYERATRGAVREFWKDGVLIGESRQPSDGLLKWLLTHLAPEKFGPQDKFSRRSSRVPAARAGFAEALDLLADSAVPGDRLSAPDFRPLPPQPAHEPITPPANLDEEEWDDSWFDEPEEADDAEDDA